MQKQINFILSGLLFTLYFFHSLSWADDAPLKLRKNLENIKTFQAKFEQKIRDANNEHVAKSQGKIIVNRPGKFYWKSQSPDPVLVIADGKFLWTYDIDLSQVTKQPLKEALGNSPAALLAGDLSQLSDNFKISYGKSQCQKSEECYLLRPVQKDAQFANIAIGFSQGKVVEVRMRDSLGQDVYTHFSAAELNAKVDGTLFSFSPPKGVDIIQAGK